MDLAAFMPAIGAPPPGVLLSAVRSVCPKPGPLRCGRSRRALYMQSESADAPAIGLVPAAGTTGTCAANLWPIPVLGAYGWNLFVWKRADMHENVVCVRAHDEAATKLTFSIVPEAATEHQTECRTISGIVTGDYNVASALAQLHASAGAGYRLTFLDGLASSFMHLKTKVTREESAAPRSLGQFWSSDSLHFRALGSVGAQSPGCFQLLQVSFC
jgi:hypothetical protein